MIEKNENSAVISKVLQLTGRISIILIFIIGFSMSIAIFRILRHFEQQSFILELKSEAKHNITTLKKHFVSNMLMIESIRGLYNASYNVEKDEFLNFVSPYLNRYSGIQALAWAPRITAGDKGIPIFDFPGENKSEKPVQAGMRDEYFPIFYIEPLGNDNTMSGYDLLSESIIGEVIKQAIETGEITATPPVVLPGLPEKQRYFMLINPVYRNSSSTGTVSDRRKNISGIVIAIFNSCEFLKEALNDTIIPDINIHVYYESDLYENCFSGLNMPLSYQNISENSSAPSRAEHAPFVINRSLDFGGRTWRVQFDPSTEFYQKHGFRFSGIFLILSLMSTLLLSIYLVLNYEKNSKLKAINKELKAEEARRMKIENDLRKSADDLNSRVKELNCLYSISNIVEQHLTSPEQVFRKAVDVIRDALTYPDVTYVKISYNGVLYRTEGYQPSPVTQSADIMVNGEPKGYIEISCIGEESVQNRKFVCAGEDRLIEVIARRLGRFIESYLSQKEKQQLENQLMHSEKLASIGQLASGVAHEINNPTGFVSSNLNTLSDYLKDIQLLITEYRRFNAGLAETVTDRAFPEYYRDHHAGISKIEKAVDIDFILDDIINLITESKDGVERIRQIVSDLKDYAHPGKKNASYANVNNCLESTLNIVWNEIKYKADILKDYGDIPDIKCYPQELNQVFMNLLVNAVQSIKEKGEIKISTAFKNDHVEIMISDTGQGIPKKDQSKIFDPFFTTKDIGRGTGLGLNVVYSIIQKHQGTIDVQSEVGKGTTFTINLEINPDLPEPTENIT